MVGKSGSLSNSRAAMNGDQTFKPDDLESAISSTRRRQRFRDVANIAIENDFHAELKRKLKHEVDSYGLEKYRKSLDEVKQIKNKKVRAFYEAQNERLNDWLEVDSLVMNMADDVLDSMNPQDVDGDGVAEEGGKLMQFAGDIEPLLPEDEREKRRVGEKRARWAINVSAGVGQFGTRQQRFPASHHASLVLSFRDDIPKGNQRNSVKG